MCQRGAPSGYGAGQPILPSTGEKYRDELDYAGSGPDALSFARTYRSTWASDPSHATTGLGQVWTHNHGSVLKATPSTTPNAVTITSAEGYVRTFVLPAGSSNWSATNSADTLLQITGGGWSYRRADDNSTLTFDASGKLLSASARNGWTHTYAYNALGQLATIGNGFGRSLVLAYNGSGQLTTVTTSDARVIGYAYDSAGRLSVVTYPDGKTRSFAYENASFPQALTGIFDESGARWGTFVYDAQGRATSTELAGAVNRYQVSYPAAGTATVIDPLSTSRSFSYSATKGKLAVTGGSLPSGTGESDAASRVQDANGLITSETDFKSIKTDTTWDVARRLPLSVTRAVGTPESQTVTTQWHATFSLPVLVTESGRTTAYTYDDKGNVLSRAVTDTASSPNTTRTWQWTWNPQGLAATETAPNGAVTTFEYDTLGNLTKAVNVLGHETLYSYDTANRVISTTAPNGLVTTYAYDARDRLLTRTVGGQHTTTLTYKPTGLVDTLTLPTGLVLSYTYDAAHRLTGWSNNRGESGTYTLDAMGNRVGEQIKNSAGTIAWTTARTINNLNRLSAKTDGPNETNSFAYDANGELTTETNGLNQSTQYGLDPLRRIKTITNAANATAGLAWNALDAVTSASDFKGAVTSYGRDAQGNATAESSADAGPRSTQYDALGLPSQIVDALGQATQIQRDALGRPTQLSFADGKSTYLRYDLSGSSYNASGAPNASKGYLSEMQDRSGITSYKRDAFGRVVQKTQVFPNGVSGSIGYSYNAQGLRESMTNPGGYPTQYLYDGTGRLVQINFRGVPQLTNITWNPMGQPTGWTWAFGTSFFGQSAADVGTSRSYDTAGRLTRVTAGGQTLLEYAYDAAGRVYSLTQQLAKPDNPADPNTPVSIAPVTWSVGYDAAGRVTSFNAPDNSAGFGYDANGNRLSSTQTMGAQTTSRSYTVAGLGNRLTGFTQSVGGANTAVSYGYNANGDLTSDGLRSFSYDAEGRLSAVTTGATDASPTTRYVHNALGQRVFKTEPLYPPAEGDESDQGFMASLIAFFTSLWNPAAAPAENLGFFYAYDEDGTLLGESGTGGANSSGEAFYLWMPTSTGPIPVMTISATSRYAIHADHLNTPRSLTEWNGALAWQWTYSAFGDAQPTVEGRKFANVAHTSGDFEFNLRYPGQTADKESGLFYNYFRSYSPSTGRYTQPDPSGLDGGWNRSGYAHGNPLEFTDSKGLVPNPAEAACALGPNPICIGGVAADLLTWIAPGALAGAGLYLAGRVDDPAAQIEHDAYKKRSLETPPPDQNECERLKWLLKREQDVVAGMQAWDAKWLPGRHDEAIRQRMNGIDKLKDRIRQKCGGCD
ncbi:RHS repeat-associated core domain-containing protein [Variovorax sp. WS11]|uniref:RHS repeat-associated core domain-containing protein n=1 Tax=Variovorax sp. WS11 TaxID=1105204 RepID=UPI0013D9CDA8|nr:RHS repeat-associated core domain-containing protein [Variovorax sp. WS11]NDZ12030.1 hypothetical protein [Variovorax sp. WS11]